MRSSGKSGLPVFILLSLILFGLAVSPVGAALFANLQEYFEKCCPDCEYEPYNEIKWSCKTTTEFPELGTNQITGTEYKYEIASPKPFCEDKLKYGIEVGPFSCNEKNRAREAGVSESFIEMCCDGIPNKECEYAPHQEIEWQCPEPDKIVGTVLEIEVGSPKPMCEDRVLDSTEYGPYSCDQRQQARETGASELIIDSCCEGITPPPPVPPQPPVPPRPRPEPPVPPVPPVPPEIKKYIQCVDSEMPQTAEIGKPAWESFMVPEPYEYITSFECKGKGIRAGVTISDNWKDIHAWRLRDDQLADLESCPTTGDVYCGDYAMRDYRAQELAEMAPDELGIKEISPFVEKEAIISPEDEKRAVEAEPVRIELAEPPETQTKIQILNVRENVPAADNPSLRIFGTPFMASIAPEYKGAVSLSGKLDIPAFIDKTSAKLYARLGSQWRLLTTEINPEGSYTAVINDITPFMKEGKALFAWMGVLSPTEQESVLRKEYDGQGARNAVILVHGFTSDAMRWQIMIDDFSTTNAPFQIWTYSYPLSTTVEDTAGELAYQLEANEAEYDNLNIVGHSVGGFIAQKAMQIMNENNYAAAQDVKKIILAGQPGLGSPSAEVYGRLFNRLVNIQTPAAAFNPESPMIYDVVKGRQFEMQPGTEYFVIAGTQTYPFTKELFVNPAGGYDINDGIISTYSARQVDNTPLDDMCENYFEAPITHTDMIDYWLSRKIIERIIAKEIAEQDPQAAIVGYNQHVRVNAGDCEEGDVVILGGIPISEDEAFDPANCKCGNGICGVGENKVNCPADCARPGLQFLCRLAPFILGPLALLLLILTSFYVYNSIKRHERTPTAKWLMGIAGANALLLTLHYLFCGFTMPFAVITMAFILSLLGFTFAHLRTKIPAKKASLTSKKIDETSVKELEKFIRKARY